MCTDSYGKICIILYWCALAFVHCQFFFPSCKVCQLKIDQTTFSILVKFGESCSYVYFYNSQHNECIIYIKVNSKCKTLLTKLSHPSSGMMCVGTAICVGRRVIQLIKKVLLTFSQIPSSWPKDNKMLADVRHHQQNLALRNPSMCFGLFIHRNVDDSMTHCSVLYDNAPQFGCRKTADISNILLSHTYIQ